MRARQLIAAAVLAACVTGLTACRTNVGTAASLNGHRFTESDVTRYVTAKAVSVPETDPVTNLQVCIAPRTWVLRALLGNELFGELLDRAPGGGPAPADIAAAQASLLQGNPASLIIDQYTSHGYTADFARLYLHEQSLEQLLSSQVQAGLDARKSLAALGVHVSVNPRYGAWDPNSYQLGGSATGGVPKFLTLKSDYQLPDFVSGSSAPATSSTTCAS